PGASRLCPRIGARRPVLGDDAARRAGPVSLDGWAGRDAVRRARLFERDIQRRHLHVHAEFARQRRTRHRQHDFARTVLVGSVFGHILISPLLIFGWGPMPALGPAGAGWGLVTSFGVGSLVLLAYLRSAHSLVKLKFRSVALRWELFAD